MISLVWRYVAGRGIRDAFLAPAPFSLLPVFPPLSFPIPFRIFLANPLSKRFSTSSPKYFLRLPYPFPYPTFLYFLLLLLFFYFFLFPVAKLFSTLSLDCCHTPYCSAFSRSGRSMVIIRKGGLAHRHSQC